MYIHQRSLKDLLRKLWILVLRNLMKLENLESGFKVNNLIT
jgi:hypothetical protein